MSVSRDAPPPRSALTATTAAAALAALPPSPLDSGSPLRDAERDATGVAERAQKRHGRDAGGVTRRLARQAAAIARDIGDNHAGFGQARRHLVARFVQREAEDVEPAGDVGDGRGRKHSHGCHER